VIEPKWKTTHKKWKIWNEDSRQLTKNGRYGMKIQETFEDIQVEELLSQVPIPIYNTKTVKMTKKKKKNWY